MEPDVNYREELGKWQQLDHTNAIKTTLRWYEKI
jgi:hypothetical protein